MAPQILYNQKCEPGQILLQFQISVFDPYVINEIERNHFRFAQLFDEALNSINAPVFNNHLAFPFS